MNKEGIKQKKKERDDTKSLVVVPGAEPNNKDKVSEKKGKEIVLIC